jgi:hypothetical protein
MATVSTQICLFSLFWGTLADTKTKVGIQTTMGPMAGTARTPTDKDTAPTLEVTTTLQAATTLVAFLYQEIDLVGILSPI